MGERDYFMVMGTSTLFGRKKRLCYQIYTSVYLKVINLFVICSQTKPLLAVKYILIGAVSPDLSDMGYGDSNTCKLKHGLCSLQ